MSKSFHHHLIGLWTFRVYNVADKPPGEQKMNLSFTFSIREISEVKDSDQVGDSAACYVIRFVIVSSLSDVLVVTSDSSILYQRVTIRLL